MENKILVQIMKISGSHQSQDIRIETSCTILTIVINRLPFAILIVYEHLHTEYSIMEDYDVHII